MDNLTSNKYEKFKQEREKEMFFSARKHQKKADKAYNRGLWNAVKWRNPLAWLILKRPN